MSSNRVSLSNHYSAHALLPFFSMEVVSLYRHAFSLPLHRSGTFCFFISLALWCFYNFMCSWLVYFYWIKCLGCQELGLFSTSSSLLVGSLANLFITFVSSTCLFSVYLLETLHSVVLMMERRKYSCNYVCLNIVIMNQVGTCSLECLLRLT